MAGVHSSCRKGSAAWTGLRMMVRLEHPRVGGAHHGDVRAMAICASTACSCTGRISAFWFITEWSWRPAAIIGPEQSDSAVLAGVFVVCMVSRSSSSRIESEDQGVEPARPKRIGTSRSTRQIVDAASSQRHAFTGRYHHGPENAPMHIVMFTDYQCPDCQQHRAAGRADLPRAHPTCPSRSSTSRSAPTATTRSATTSTPTPAGPPGPRRRRA